MAPKRASGSSSRSSTELLRIGRVGRPHGTEGAFTVTEATERTELLDPGRSVFVADRKIAIAARHGTAEHPILTLDGVGDRTAAEALRGAPLAVPRGALGAFEEGEFLVDDLVGCAVADGERAVGRVRDVLLLPSADSLEVELLDGGELLVPLIGDAVRSIDLDARRIDVDLRFLEH
jgi:16S rRNA processing protein RimM